MFPVQVLVSEVDQENVSLLILQVGTSDFLFDVGFPKLQG